MGWPPAPRSTSGPSSPRRWSSRSTTRGSARSAVSVASDGVCRTCSRGPSRTSRRSSTTVRSPFRKPKRWPVPAQPGRHRHRRRARQGLHDDPQPGAQAPRSADHRVRARSSSTVSSARHSSRRSGRSPGRPACRVDVRLVHAAVTSASIDGYALTNPVGFQGRHVQIGIFNAFAPLVHLGALQGVASQLDLELLEIVAEPYAVARVVLGTEQVRQAGALFVDVGGGTTDVALVRQGGIEGTRMFALGGRAFTKSIADRLDLPFPRAEERSRSTTRVGSMSTAGRTSRASSARMSAYGRPGSSWSWRSCRAAICCRPHLPVRRRLASAEIRRSQAEAFWKHMPFSRPPEVTVLSPDQIETVVDATDLLVDQQDVTPLGRLSGDRAPDDGRPARRRPQARAARDEGVTTR